MSVLPDTFSAQVSLELPFYQTDEEESYAPDRKGYDLSEIYQLRDYVQGDPIRQIHWKLSGKLDTLIVRDPSLPVSRSLLVLWDKNTAESSPIEMDAMAEAVASVCQELSQNGMIYTLAWTMGRNCAEKRFRERMNCCRSFRRCISQVRIWRKVVWTGGWKLMEEQNMERYCIFAESFQRR